jgi:hypothetical protein
MLFVWPISWKTRGDAFPITMKLDTFTIRARSPEMRIRMSTGAVSIFSSAPSDMFAPVAKLLRSVSESKNGTATTSPTKMSGEAW